MTTPFTCPLDAFPRAQAVLVDVLEIGGRADYQAKDDETPLENVWPLS